MALTELQFIGDEDIDLKMFLEVVEMMKICHCGGQWGL